MQDEKNKLIFQTCLLLVGHITNLVEHEKSTGIRIGYHSRIFDSLLHPQEHFISLGKSESLYVIYERTSTGLETTNNIEFGLNCASFGIKLLNIA